MDIARKNAERLGDHMFDFSSTPSPGVQAKLNVGEVGDKYEQEADSVAGQVVEEINSPQGQVEPNVMRQCYACEGEKEESSTSLQRQGDELSNHSARATQDVFVRQGAYASQGRQVQKKPANSQNQNSKQSSVWEEAGGAFWGVIWWFGATYIVNPTAEYIGDVLRIEENQDKAPQNPDVVS